MTQDCPLDRVIRGTFEWREVANILGSFGVRQPEWRLGNRHARVVGESTYRMADAMAHRDPDFVGHIRRLLGHIHSRQLEEVRGMSFEQLRRLVRHDFQPAETGWLWAMLSDDREEVVEMAKVWVRESVG
jgi:hypothetical protein